MESKTNNPVEWWTPEMLKVSELWDNIDYLYPGQFKLPSEKNASKMLKKWAEVITPPHLDFAEQALILYSRDNPKYPPTAGAIYEYAKAAKKSPEPLVLTDELIEEIFKHNAPPKELSESEQWENVKYSEPTLHKMWDNAGKECQDVKQWRAWQGTTNKNPFRESFGSDDTKPEDESL